MKSAAIAAIAAIAVAAPASAAASTYKTPAPASAAHAPAKPNCRPHYVAKRERRHHKLTWRCVPEPKPKPIARQPITATTATTTPEATPVPIVTRAAIDPTYQQDPSDPRRLTFTFSASDAVIPTAVLPAGTLTLTVSVPGGAVVGGCTIDVGGGASAVTGGTYTVELPYLGQYSVTVSYAGASSTVAPSSTTYLESVLPFSTSTTLATKASGSATQYTATTWDQNANVVAVDASSVQWTVTDTTTGNVVLDWYYNVGASAVFRIITDYDSHNQPIGQAVALYRNATDSVPVASSSAINPNDAFTVAASYTPAGDAPYTGSTSTAQPLVLSP